MFVAGKPINVTRGGKLVQLKVGDPVPEAKDWGLDVLARCKRQGQIVETSDPESVLKAREALITKRLPKTAEVPSTRGVSVSTHNANVEKGIAKVKEQKTKSSTQTAHQRRKAAKAAQASA